MSSMSEQSRVPRNDSSVTVVGLVSDTHGLLDSSTIEILKRATGTIIHAGDVGDKGRKTRLSARQVIERLEEATGNAVIAVAGNVDEGVADLHKTRTVTIAGVRILAVHICGFPPKISPESQRLIDEIGPQVVVFGHSHIPGARWYKNILYVNPGSAGPRRFKLPRCVALLSISVSGVFNVQFISVTTLQRDIEGLPAPLTEKVGVMEGASGIRSSNSPPPNGVQQKGK